MRAGKIPQGFGVMSEFEFLCVHVNSSVPLW